MPRLSVIVPIYNTEKYLRDCIDSILAQTFTDFELILVDDGSTDRSGIICDEYAQSDCRIRVVHQENAGVTRARKIGATLAIGDYVTYVDSDDWVDSETYHTIMLNIEKFDADIGVFSMIMEKRSPSVITNNVGEGFYSKEMMEAFVYPKMLFDYSENRAGIIASLCNKVIKREILQKSITDIPDDLEYGEDAISGYKSLLNASSAYVCNKTFYHYRDNPSSISHANLAIMRNRILVLDHEMRRNLSGYDMNISEQINGHITRHTVEQVRAELLYLTGESFYKRLLTVKDFCSHSKISLALGEAYPEICDKKEKIKVFLIRHKLFWLLYFLFKKV